MKNSHNKRLIKILVLTALSAAVLMTAFEMIKQLLHSDITIWQSHISTIAFTTFVTVFLTYVALREHYSLLRILSGFIPICAWCKKIRDEKGNWVSFEQYLGRYSSAEFTHGVCPQCSDDLLIEVKTTD